MAKVVGNCSTVSVSLPISLLKWPGGWGCLQRFLSYWKPIDQLPLFIHDHHKLLMGGAEFAVMDSKEVHQSHMLRLYNVVSFGGEAK